MDNNRTQEIEKEIEHLRSDMYNKIQKLQDEWVNIDCPFKKGDIVDLPKRFHNSKDRRGRLVGGKRGLVMHVYFISDNDYTFPNNADDLNWEIEGKVLDENGKENFARFTIRRDDPYYYDIKSRKLVT